MDTVHIELLRVQTWLFAVPRLRAMRGANALIGRVLREQLPALARDATLVGKPGAWGCAPVPGADTFPSSDPQDPLASDDDPGSDAMKGIESRDGGHFEVWFEHGGREFAGAAAALIRAELPGLPFSIRVNANVHEQPMSSLSIELPVFEPCEWTGRGVASWGIRQGQEHESVSTDVARRHEESKKTEGNRDTAPTAVDLATRLRQQIPSFARLTRPQDLKDLVGNGYLAVIHADGNGVGSRAPKDPKDRALRAEFFHRNRVRLRRALSVAIDERCRGVPNNAAAPLDLLMLGGDDVLVVVQATHALDFVMTLCRALQDVQQDIAVRDRLTLGVGVAIARQSIPFHRLHETAEWLASSAKRQWRGASGDSLSFIDWTVSTADAPVDVAGSRGRDWVRRQGNDRYVLSQRPMAVLGEGLATLTGLLAAAGLVGARGAASGDRDGAPRSQLRYLVEQLGQGRHLSELAFEDLSGPTLKPLTAAGVKRPWVMLAPGVHVTPLLDLVEISEIPLLGKSDELTAREGTSEIALAAGRGEAVL